MKTLIIAALLVLSTAAVAGGDSNRQGAPEDSWLGDSNTTDTQRSLLVKCPDNTTAGSVAVQTDDQGAVIVIECNYE